MVREMNRRKFIAGTAAAGAALLAGCTSGVLVQSDDEQELKQRVPVPQLNESLLKGWKQDGETWAKKYFDEGPISAVGHGIRYQNAQLSERVEKETLGRIENQTLSQFFAVRIDFFPGFASFATGLKDIGTQTQNEFEQQLRSQQALQNIRTSGIVEVVQTDTGQQVDLRGYSAEYPVEEIIIEDVDIPDVGERSFVIPQQRLPIEGVIGHWKHDGSLYVAGGVYPNDDFTVQPRTSLTGEKGQGIDIVIDVNIELDSVQREVNKLIRSVK